MCSGKKPNTGYGFSKSRVAFGLWTLFNIGIVVIIIHKRGVVYHSSSTVKNQANEARPLQEVKDEQPVHIIILASKRTGSSFVGELLGRNPDIWYLFEPLKRFTFDVLKGNLEADLFESETIEMLDKVFKCEFQDANIVSALNPESMCSRNNLQDDRLCRLLQEKNLDIGKTEQLLTTICRNYRYRAIKTIRIYDLELLRSYAADPSMNIKIVHLVRDPRGIMNSRRKLGESNHDFERKNVPWDETVDLCKDLARNLHIAESYPTWLLNRYMLVRYEDIARQPETVAEHIYEFLGLTMPEEITQWIKKNTSKSSGGPYGTSRNSNITATSWTKQLPFTNVLSIQNKCKIAMEMLGYKSVENAHELTEVENVLGSLDLKLSKLSN